MCSNAGKIVSIENGPNRASPPSRKARRRSGMVGGVWADGMGDGRGKLTAFVGAVSAAPAGAATRGPPSYAACDRGPWNRASALLRTTQRPGAGQAAPGMYQIPVRATGSTPAPRYNPPRCTQRSEEHTSELQSLMRISYAVFCLKKKTYNHYNNLDHK